MTVQMGLGNGSIMSGKKLVILDFKYLQNKKWQKQLQNILIVLILLR